MKFRNKVLLAAGFVLAASPVSAEVLKLSLKGSVVPGGTLSKMAAMKAAYQNNDFKKCAALGKEAAKEAQDALPWVTGLRLECAARIGGTGDPSIGLGDALNTLEKNRDWLLIGPYAAKLRRRLVEAELVRLDWLVVRDRGAASRNLEAAFSHLEWMDDAQRSKLFRMAGEIAFLEQRLKTAENYLLKSLTEKETDDVRRRLDAVRALLKSKDSESAPAQVQASPPEFSPKEKEIADRMTVALKGGELVVAVEDGIDLIRSYPGSSRAKWATDRVWEVYSQVASKEDEKYTSLRERLVGKMSEADGLRLYGWVEKAFRMNGFADVVTWSRVALKKLDGTVHTTKLLSWAAHAAWFTGDNDSARRSFIQLTEKHSGTAEALTALFRLGLLDFRAKEYTSAAAYFERLLVFPDSQNLELSARYWLWRSLQKLGAERAKEEAVKIVEKFPLSYYGLRARAEMENKQLKFRDLAGDVSTEMELTAPEKKAWRRAQVLIRGDWFDEAQEELKGISAPASPKGRALFARFWASANGFTEAIGLMNAAWDEDGDLRVIPFIKVIFPFPYKKEISKECNQYGLDPYLVVSLIRQESAFNPRAVSTSNACGLMQMIPPTAQEVATELKMKGLRVPEDMFLPPTNIPMGIYYLNKMVKQFAGNVPFALASYNAGPDRIQRWAKARGINVATLTSDPEYEVWIDELPWTEPNFYVKAILRNLLIYKTLDRGRVELADPLWGAEKN